jgi:hypothetical protein
MRRLCTLVLLLVPFICGCGSTAKQDVAAAKEFVKGFYSNPAIDFKVDKVEGPEYAKAERIPRDHIAKGYPDRSAACAVKVWFTWRDGRSTTHDSWVVWVSQDHKGVGFSNPGDKEWRKWVKSVAKNPPAPASITPTAYETEPAKPSVEEESARPLAVSKPEPTKPAASSRLWKMADGSAIVRATLLSISGNQVKLRKWDGMVIKVTLEQLSQADREWIEANHEKH